MGAGAAVVVSAGLALLHAACSDAIVNTMEAIAAPRDAYAYAGSSTGGGEEEEEEEAKDEEAPMLPKLPKLPRKIRITILKRSVRYKNMLPKWLGSRFSF